MMKNPKSILYWFSSLAIVLCLSLSSFVTPRSQPTEIRDQIKAEYLDNLEAFKSAVDELSRLTHAWPTQPENTHAIQRQFIACRNAYKKIEFLAEYYDPEFVKKHINGAPLPRLSTDDNKVMEEPEGMQTLEELILSDEVEQNQTDIVALTQRLREYVKIFLPFQYQHPLYNRFVFEASRTQLVRIFTLSLTGFDTPMSGRGIQEAHLSLLSVADAIKLYYPLMDEKSPSFSPKLEALFAGALEYLEAHGDFDSFDRLHFLTTYVNPLFASLGDAHKLLGLPTVYETNFAHVKRALNPEARNIFSEDFLNPFYFTELLKEQYTPQSIELGRTLFFDPILSDKFDRSCASCHQPERAFTDGQKKSIARGFKGTINRNAPSLVNAVYSKRLFWDLRAERLEDQIHHVIFSEQEFNSSFAEIFERLNQSQEYQKLFQSAFPLYKDRPIHRYTLATALSSYVVSLRGFNSSFDQYVKGESTTIAPEVKRGFNLFMGKAACGTCHFAPTFSGLVPPLFTETESEILGVPENKDTLHAVLDTDPGRSAGRVKENFVMYHRSFKTTTVRNTELTGPYMHNGVYDELEEVMDFYNRGGGIGLGFDLPYQTLPPDPLGLDEQEIQDVIAFMKSLTNQNIPVQRPEKLPAYPADSPFSQRKIGGVY